MFKHHWWLKFLGKSWPLVFIQGISRQIPSLFSSSISSGLSSLLRPLLSQISAPALPSFLPSSPLRYELASFSTLPARDDSQCWYVEKEKEEEEWWSKCGEGNLLFVLFSLDRVPSWLSCEKKPVHLYPQCSFIFPSLSTFIFPATDQNFGVGTQAMFTVRWTTGSAKCKVTRTGGNCSNPEGNKGFCSKNYEEMPAGKIFLISMKIKKETIFCQPQLYSKMSNSNSMLHC